MHHDIPAYTIFDPPSYISWLFEKVKEAPENDSKVIKINEKQMEVSVGNFFLIRGLLRINVTRLFFAL